MSLIYIYLCLAHKGYENKNDSTNSTESSGSLHLFYFTDTKLSYIKTLFLQNINHYVQTLGHYMYSNRHLNSLGVKEHKTTMYDNMFFGLKTVTVNKKSGNNKSKQIIIFYLQSDRKLNNYTNCIF